MIIFTEKIVRFLACMVGRLLPIRRKVCLFRSHLGMYNDNPKWISERLHIEYPDVVIYWTTSVDCHDEMPRYVKTVQFNSIKYWLLVARAHVLITTDYCMRGSVPKKGSLKSLAGKIYAKKRSGQLVIATWHGTPLKLIGLDVATRKGRCVVSDADYMIAGTEFTKNALTTAFNISPIKMVGTPRNDILLDPTINVSILKKRLELPENRKILLFAPTYRSNLNDGKIQKMSAKEFDGLFKLEFKKLIEALNTVTGDEWCIVLRIHAMLLRSVDRQDLIRKYGNCIIDGNIGDDMAEYLACSDILITDYSSCMFDFALTKKPIFLFAPDREHYEKKERGMYMDFNALPFPKSYTSDELIEQIYKFDSEDYCSKVERLLIDIGNVEDGHASERIVDDIIHFIETGEKR